MDSFEKYFMQLLETLYEEPKSLVSPMFGLGEDQDARDSIIYKQLTLFVERNLENTSDYIFSPEFDPYDSSTFQCNKKKEDLLLEKETSEKATMPDEESVENKTIRETVEDVMAMADDKPGSIEYAT